MVRLFRALYSALAFLACLVLFVASIAIGHEARGERHGRHHREH